MLKSHLIYFKKKKKKQKKQTGIYIITQAGLYGGPMSAGLEEFVCVLKTSVLDFILLCHSLLFKD